MSRRLSRVIGFAVAALLLGCQKPVEPIPIADAGKDYDRPLPPGEWALRKLDPSEYPDFGAGWYGAKGSRLRMAIEHSIAYLNKPSSQRYFPSGPITHDRALASLKLFLQELDNSPSPQALNESIRNNFDVYISVGCDNAGTVLFTGYYSPIFDGSKTRTERFRYPLYKLPPGFEKDPDGNPAQGLWHTRAEIEAGGVLDGQEIAWLGDRFETYVLTVQGSGFIRLEDGTLYEIGYAGNNGHEYTPVGRLMVADGKIAKNQLSLDTLIRYFRDHPEDLDTYLNQNKRYVFFQDSKGGPYGCLGVPVTQFHSVATDKDIFPRACLAFYADTSLPLGEGQSMRRASNFVCDQDRGAAIRAPGRCDIYMGVGDEAGKMAGFTYSEGRLYYLFTKELADSGGPVAGGVNTDRRDYGREE